MRAPRTFSHPMVPSSLLQNLQLPLLNPLHLPSPSTPKLKSQRVRKIRTEILRRASAKLLRLSLLLPKNNNNLQWLLQTRIYSRPSLKINRFSKQLSPNQPLPRSSRPTSSKTNSRLLQVSLRKVRWQPLNTQLCSRWASKVCSTGPSSIRLRRARSTRLSAWFELTT